MSSAATFAGSVRPSPSLRWPVALAAGCLLAGAFSLLLPSAPLYDPWAWLVWGREIAHGSLDTVTGPTWKPLTVFICVPLAWLGSIAPLAWMVIAHAGGFAGVAAVAVLAYRSAGLAAGLLGGSMLLLATWFWSETLSGFSEGLLVVLVVAAVDRGLAWRPRWCFVLLLLAGLLRPEAWPFLAAAGGWLAWQRPRNARWIVLAGAVVVGLWLIPEQLGSGDAFRGAARAQEFAVGSPALSDTPALTVLAHGVGLVPWIGRVGIGLLLLQAAARRRFGWGLDLRGPLRNAAVAAAVGTAWLTIVALLTLTGFSPGINRYLIVPAALFCIVGAIGWGCALRALHDHGGTTALALCGVAALIGLYREAIDWSPVIRQTERNADIVRDADRAIDLAGGRQAVRGCSPVLSSYYLTPMMAWKLDLPLKRVTDSSPRFGVLFRARLYLNARPDPPLAWSRLGTSGTAARTRYWQIDVAGRCG